MVNRTGRPDRGLRAGPSFPGRVEPPPGRSWVRDALSVSGAEFKVLRERLASGFRAVIGVGPSCVRGMAKLEVKRAEDSAWGSFAPPGMRRTSWLGWGAMSFAVMEASIRRNPCNLGMCTSISRSYPVGTETPSQT